MEHVHYHYFSHASELAPPQESRGDNQLLLSTLELYDSALNGRTYNSERNPYSMPEGRRQELLEDHIENSHLIIATPQLVQKRAIGVASFYPEQTETGNVLWVEGLAVDERYRKKSIGRNLLQHIEQHARTAGLGSLALRSIPGAIQFYEHLGFSKENNDHQPIFTKQL